MWMTRIISEEEREIIRQAKQKEKEYLGYLSGAVKRMTSKKTNYKLRGMDK